jgi:hypothetical protein
VTNYTKDNGSGLNYKIFGQVNSALEASGIAKIVFNQEGQEQIIEGFFVKDGYKVIRYIFDNGEYFIGQYSENRRNGYGKQVYTSGEIKQGQWKEDIF